MSDDLFKLDQVHDGLNELVFGLAGLLAVEIRRSRKPIDGAVMTTA
jgi:hypothetical protein